MNNINIIFNDNSQVSSNKVNINDFLDLNELNNTIDNNNYLSINDFLIETDKLTKYNAIRVGYGEMLELYYDEHYLVNDLLRICDYYGLLKTIKSLKCKKQEIIDIIVMYEKDENNKEIVERRHQLWSYIIELKNDKFMKQFIAF